MKLGEGECEDKSHQGAEGDGAFLSLSFHSQSLGMAGYRAVPGESAPVCQSCSKDVLRDAALEQGLPCAPQ